MSCCNNDFMQPSDSVVLHTYAFVELLNRYFLLYVSEEQRSFSSVRSFIYSYWRRIMPMMASASVISKFSFTPFPMHLPFSCQIRVIIWPTIFSVPFSIPLPFAFTFSFTFFISISIPIPISVVSVSSVTVFFPTTSFFTFLFPS